MTMTNFNAELQLIARNVSKLLESNRLVKQLWNLLNGLYGRARLAYFIL